jgi:hypothetical protein
MGHVPSVVRVSRCSRRYGVQQVAGNHDVCRSSTDALAGTLPKGIDATGAHVAVATAQFDKILTGKERKEPERQRSGCRRIYGD